MRKQKRKKFPLSTYLDELLLPMDTALVDLSVVDISAEQGVAFGHGQTVAVENLPDGIVKVIADGKFVGIGERNPQGLLKAKRALSSAQPESQ